MRNHTMQQALNGPNKMIKENVSQPKTYLTNARGNKITSILPSQTVILLQNTS